MKGTVGEIYGNFAYVNEVSSWMTMVHPRGEIQMKSLSTIWKVQYCNP